MDPELLPVKPFQETLNRGFCGPATIKMILDYYGIEKTEDELAILTNKSDELGITDQDTKRALESFGFKVEIINYANFEDIKAWLDKDVPVIVDWFTRGRNDGNEDEMADGHYSVAVGLDEKYIYLQDPEVGRIRKILKKDFLRVWFDFLPNHIEKWEDMVIRQIIVAYK
jgi:predicted double-glycine peptidase